MAAWDEDEEGSSTVVARMASTAHHRYAEIMRDVEALINDHSMKRPRLPSVTIAEPQ